MIQITFKPKNICIDSRPEESIYEAAARQSVRMPISCRNGVCEICRANLLEGQVQVGREAKLIEAGAEILLCKASAATSCVIEMEGLYAPGELPVNKLACQIQDVTLLQSNVYRIILRLPAGKMPETYAGQYLALQLPSREDPSFYSIASRPGLRDIELHIQADPHLENAVEVIEFLRNSVTANISLPFGKACLTKLPEQPIIFVAAGTGFAQMKSVVEYLLSEGYKHSISLYWGVRQEAEMYTGLAEEWAAQHDQVEFHPSIADIQDNQGVEHHEQLAQAVMREHGDFADSLVFVSGSPRLVFTVMDTLVEAGLPKAQFFSDVLEYAPR